MFLFMNQTCYFLMLIKLFICGYVNGNQISEMVVYCPFGMNIGSNQSPFLSKLAKSVVHCTAVCREQEVCRGFNVVKNSDGTVTCDFMNGQYVTDNMVDMPAVRYYTKDTEAATTTVIPTTTEAETTVAPVPMRDCKDLQDSGQLVSGVYQIDTDLTGSAPNLVNVFCDMTTDGGGWMVLLRRQDGSVDFEKLWADYRDGFGSLTGEFWAGNELMYKVTSTFGKTYKLRVDMTSFTNENRYAIYQNFVVGSEASEYPLSVGAYSGDALDSLSYHDGLKFTTPDKDNDLATYNCGAKYHNGWWYKSCSAVRLTGLYGQSVADDQETVWNGFRFVTTTFSQGILWFDWLGSQSHPKYADMKIKPA